MRTGLFDDLLNVIKRKSAIRNTEQAVEIISLFILIQYIKIYLFSKNFTYASCHDISFRDMTEVKCYYQKIYDDYLDTTSVGIKGSAIHKNIIEKINFSFNNINDVEIIKYIDLTLSCISSLEDFYHYADAYHSLILRMVSESGQSGEYFTPKSIIKLMVKVLSPEHGKSIYDPACGTSGLLLEAANYIHKYKKSDYTLSGQDASSFACLISIVNLLMNGEKNFDIILKDSIMDDLSNQKYDFVLTNPPFGKKINLSSLPANIRYRGHHLDYYFLEHIMNSLNVNGKAAIILPERFLYDESKECIDLKINFFQHYNLEYILSIPSGAMLPYTAVKLCILFFSNTGSTHDVYIYKINKSEKYSRTNVVKFEDFEEFLSSIKTKSISEHSWIINVNEIATSYNMLQNRISTNIYGVLDKPLSSLELIINNNHHLIEDLKSLKEKIYSLEASIQSNSNDYQFDKIKIGDIAKIKAGNLLQKKKLLTDGPVPVYGGNGVIGFYHEAMEYGETIIIGKIGALCGNVRYTEDKIWVTNNALVLKNEFPQKFVTAYIAKILSVTDLRKLAVGTAQQYITITQVKNIEVSIPPFEIQHKLNIWLDELDHTIEQYSKLIEKIKSDKEIVKDNLFKNLLIP